MAKLFPSLDNIKRLKVQPTEGELFLINHLSENLSDDIEIYFQPFLNGDRPDIILMQKNMGVSIIEVKDWNLSLYGVDKNNKWYLKENKAQLLSPFQQVFNYKDNLFNLHINGLLHAKIKNKTFYGRINTYVYFHKSSNSQLNRFYSHVLEYYRDMEQSNNNDFKNEQISHEQYKKKFDYIKRKKEQINRDLGYCSITPDNLKAIKLPKDDNAYLFTDEIYQEFRRVLQPTSHTVEDGIEIQYTTDQQKFIESKDIREKILGIAGSGKTVVIAKRAVNAYKRHESQVLVLTYNITLKRYIHDRISDARESFRWDYFYINNYHGFIVQELNNLGIEFGIPEEIQKSINKIHNYEEKEDFIERYFDQKYFSNRKLFEKHKDKIQHRFKTILIDEVQDYNPDWIKILRDFFAEENSEIVLFGDEKQNIYERDYDEKDFNSRRPVIVQGFGEWKKLKESIRFKLWNSSLILPLVQNFQIEFLKNKYETDKDDKVTIEKPSLKDNINQILFKMVNKKNKDWKELAKNIINEIRKNSIHNDDIVILASRIQPLQEIDFIIRNEYGIQTITTFETKEMHEKHANETQNIRKYKKIAFNHHSGKIKISTIHSYKGYEAQTVFLIINNDDNEEMIYTGITRSKLNLVVFVDGDSKYNNFFRQNMSIQ